MRIIRFCILFLFISFSVLALGQNNKIDSLQNELKTYKKESKKRVDLLNDLAFEYCFKDITASLTYLKEARKISIKLKYIKGEAKSINVEGITEVFQSNLDQGLKLFKQSIQLYETIKDNEGISSNYNGIGVVYYYKGDYNKSIENYKISLKLDEETGDKAKIKSSLNNIGNSYSDIGEFDEAMIYYERALKINRELNDNDGIASSLNNIGTVYDDQGNYPLALEYYNKSLSIYKKIKDTIGQSRELNNLGIIYKSNENYDKATVYFKQTLEIQRKMGDKRNLCKVLNNLGIVSYRKRDFKLALNYYNEGLKISRSIDDLDNISASLNNVGDVYLEMGNNASALKYYTEAKEINLEINDQQGLCNSYLGIASVLTNQKKYKEALTNALSSNTIANKVGLLEFQSDVNKLLSEIYQRLGDYQNALESHLLFKQYDDSLFNKENIEKIAQIENEHKYKGQLESANNRELKLTEKVKTTNQDLEQSKQNYLYSIILFLLIIILLGAVIFYLRLRNIKSNTQNIIIEQRLLRSQMTPHFIFNSLSVLQGMILNKEEKKSISYLSKFSKLLRIILENSRFKTVSLAQELEAIDNYLALQNLENQSYKYSIVVEQTIDQTSVEIPPMLIQPFIENSIEHAFNIDVEDKIIDIHLSQGLEGLICTIQDNGVGVNAQKVNIRKDKNSLSTAITTERLKIISKEYKMKGSVSIVDRKINNEQGTIVTLVIPFKKK